MYRNTKTQIMTESEKIIERLCERIKELKRTIKNSKILLKQLKSIKTGGDLPF